MTCGHRHEVCSDSSQAEGKLWESGNVTCIVPPTAVTSHPRYPGRKILPPLLPPTSRAVQSNVAGNSSCCSVMLKAEKYYVKIFMNKGKCLILKEFIMAWNNLSLHTGKVGVIGSGLQSGRMGDDCYCLDAGGFFGFFC